ncbi:MAG: RsmD family RNA methyltransferase [bacterium]
MRIVSGKYKGRKLHPPSNLPVRPTTDFAKESLFNILNNLIDFESLAVLDLFSGTGSIAFEFISRGCLSVTAVDQNPRCIDFIKKASAEIGIDNLRAVRSNAFSILRNPTASFDLIFADPPYDVKELPSIPELVLTTTILNPGGLFILEHSGNYRFDDHPQFFQKRNYGSVNFTFFSMAERNA